MQDMPSLSFHNVLLKGKREAGRLACLPFPDKDDIEAINAHLNVDKRFEEPHLTVSQMEARAIDSMIAGHYSDPRYRHYAEIYHLVCFPMGARCMQELALDAAMVTSQMDIWDHEMRAFGSELLKDHFVDRFDVLTPDQLLKRLFENKNTPPHPA